MRKTFFYIHTNIVTKKWGQQNGRNNFSRNTLIVRAKNVGKKIVGKKWEKRFFLFTRISWPKNGGWGKRAKQFFQKHTNSASKKCWEINRRKKCEKRFLYSQKYRYQKMGGKKRAKQFFRNTRIVWSKNVRKKIVGKKCEKRFFIFTRISWPKNGGNKTRETIFPASH